LLFLISHLTFLDDFSISPLYIVEVLEVVLFYTLGKNEAESTSAIASVGYGKDLAFYAVAGDYEELMRIVENKVLEHFSGLLDTKNAWIRITRVSLNEIVIPDHIFNRALGRLPGRTIGEKEIPAEIAVPLEIELAPIMGFREEDYEIENLDILKKRNLLCKAEVCTLEKCDPAEAVFEEIDGRPLWKLVSREGEEEVKYVHAQISSPQSLLEMPIPK